MKTLINREEIENYFTNKHEGNQFVINALQDKTDEELARLYEIDLIRTEKENEILENGTVTYTIDFNTELKKEVEKFMWDNNLFTMYDGNISHRCGNDGRLLGVPVEFVDELGRVFDLKKSRERYVIGRKDVQSLKVGDKVKVVLDGIFGQQGDQGTVIQIEEDTVTIRRYRSKSKGFVISVGDECNMEKISKFQK